MVSISKEQSDRFPNLAKPRPWSAIFAGASYDARWAGVPAKVKTVDRNAVRIAQLKARKGH